MAAVWYYCGDTLSLQTDLPSELDSAAPFADVLQPSATPESASDFASASSALRSTTATLLHTHVFDAMPPVPPAPPPPLHSAPVHLMQSHVSASTTDSVADPCLPVPDALSESESASPHSTDGLPSAPQPDSLHPETPAVPSASGGGGIANDRILHGTDTLAEPASTSTPSASPSYSQLQVSSGAVADVNHLTLDMGESHELVCFCIDFGLFCLQSFDLIFCNLSLAT